MSKKVLWTLLGIVVVRIFVMFLLDQHTYWTFDEPWNADTAQQVLTEKQFRRTKDSFTPISIMNVFVGNEIRSVDPRVDKLTADRVAGIIFNQAAVPLLYILALQVGATVGLALFFTILLSFEPNLLGHTILAANVDGYIFTWFILLAVCAFYWVDKKNLKHATLFGLVLGLIQGVKLTSAYAVPLSLIWFLWAMRKLPRREKLKQLAGFLFFSWLGLNLFYAFNKLGTPMGAIHFISPQFQKLALHLKNFPALVPVDYLQGLDMCLNTDSIPRPVYIMNHYFMRGVWYYFLYALLLKTPLPLLVTAIVGWCLVLKKKSLTVQQKFLVLFSAFFMFYFSVLLNAQVGVRYLFPIYGFMLAGLLWFPWKKTSVIVASVWMVFSWGYNWPNFIGYFNELVPLKHHRWWHLGDSNLTWSQEWYDWVRFVTSHHIAPELSGPPTLPLNQDFYEDAITVAGILRNRQQLEFLRENFNPFDSFEGVKLEYHITPEELLAKFPAQTLPASNLPAISCDKKGFTDENKAYFADLNLLSQETIGIHVINGTLEVTEPTTIFFEVSSKGHSSITLNNSPLMLVEEPTPRLVVQTRALSPGAYPLSITWVKNQGDGFLSFRSLNVSTTGRGESMTICPKID